MALAAIYEGGTRSDAAQLGGVGLQTVRDWVLRFNGGGPDGLIDAVPPGGVPLLDDAQRRALAQIVESGPIPASHGVVRWRLIDLAQWVWGEFAIAISKQTLSRELRAMGYRKLSARPRHHAQDDDAIPTFKKLPSPSGRDPGGAPARHSDRALVARRGADRSEERDHAALGASRNAAFGAKRPAHGIGLYLWGDLPGRGQRRRARSSSMQHPGDGLASGGNLRRCRTGRARSTPSRSGRMARLRRAYHTRQHHFAAAAVEMSRAQPGGEYLAVHARQLAIEQNLQILRRHPRSLLLRMEPPRRSAVAHHVHRPAIMGALVTVHGPWYKMRSANFRYSPGGDQLRPLNRTLPVFTGVLAYCELLIFE